MREFFAELLGRAATAGEQPALVSASGSLTYDTLLQRVRAGAGWATCLPERIGLLFANPAEYAVADLALTFAGKELVPLPAFFSDGQLKSILQSAQLSLAVTDAACRERARTLGLAVTELGAVSSTAATPAVNSRRIIFTSGTTAEPKGVRLASRQMLASVRALAQATNPTAQDRYLSILPTALLLEQIAGLYLPLLSGANIHFPSPDGERGASIATQVEAVKPTATILVPELLQAWTHELEILDRTAPTSLRFVAVGGAPVPTVLITRARHRGIPAYEGYGLTECCSVVSVNRPGDQDIGTAGAPLTGLDVSIRDGEVVVAGPTTMTGYLDSAPLTGPWATGDLGAFDANGRLIIKGRKDNLIVTGAGRNISPEWIEDLIAADESVLRCIIVENEGDLIAVVIPAHGSIDAMRGQVGRVLTNACRSAPDYAKPRQYMTLRETDLHQLGLLTPNGRPRRARIRSLVKAQRRTLAVACE